jgi:hypothetical protein
MLAGTFGRVLECWDRKNKDYVAIKIVRNVQKYRDAAMIEVQLPRRTNHGDAKHTAGLGRAASRGAQSTAQWAAAVSSCSPISECA